MRADPGHDKIRREIENNIAHVKKCKTGRHLLRRDVEYRAQIVALVDVHRLSKANVRSDGRAHEVEDPKCGKDTSVEFAIFMSVH